MIFGKTALVIFWQMAHDQSTVLTPQLTRKIRYQPGPILAKQLLFSGGARRRGTASLPGQIARLLLAAAVVAAAEVAKMAVSKVATAEPATAGVAAAAR